MVNTQPSAQAAEKKENRTVTSSGMSYLDGEKDNINSTNKLAEMNAELASLLQLYAQAGGEVMGITIGNNDFFGTHHLIILPANLVGTTYALQEIAHNGQHQPKEKESTGKTKEKTPAAA